MRTVTGAELAVPTIEDGEIVKRYNLVAQRLEKRIMEVNDADYEEPRAIEDAAPQVTLDRRATGQRPATGDTLVALPAHQGAEWSNAPAPVGARAVAPVAPQGPSGAARSTAIDHQALVTFWKEEHQGAWTREKVQRALSCSKTKANQLIAQWIAAGYATELTEARYHYSWTEAVREVPL